jgi:hypothetical protein
MVYRTISKVALVVSQVPQQVGDILRKSFIIIPLEELASPAVRLMQTKIIYEQTQLLARIKF